MNYEKDTKTLKSPSN